MFNGNLAGLMTVMKLPALAVGGIGGLALMASAFGFSITGPGAVMEEYKTEHVVEHVIIDTALAEIDEHMHVQQELIESIVRGECIENPVENLQRQGLIAKCLELGITR